MSNYVVPGPNGGIPSIQYIEHLRDAGILTPRIAESQILYIKTYNEKRKENIQKRAEIIQKIIQNQSKKVESRQNELNK